MRRVLTAVAAAVALTLVATPAYAQPSGTDTADVVPADTPEAPVDPPAEPDPEPAPVDPEPVDPEPVDPAPADPVTVDPDPAPVDPEPGTPAPGTPEPGTPAPGTPEPGTPAPGTPAPGTPAPGTPAPGTVSPSETAAPTDSATADPTAAPTAAPTSTPITQIDVDVDIDDHSDHSIHIDNSVRFTFEGDRYSNVYVYRDLDGRTYRGYNCGCGDFASRADAQAAYDSSGGALSWLDRDGDGQACERESGEFTRDSFARVGLRRGGQVDVLPSGAIDTGLAA